MKLKQIPLALVLMLAVGTMAGCDRDGPAAPGADVDAPAPVALTSADPATAHTDAQDAHDDAQEAHDAHDAHDHAHDADDHAHDAAHALGMEFPVPENHVPWQPDAPLIEGMSRVRTAIAALDDAGPAQLPDAATVTARAADVDAAIAYMFANCTLDTEPDIALHAILARLMAGTQALEADPADSAAVADMGAAVDNYERLFDDPNTEATS